jgi:hypothetical protein
MTRLIVFREGHSGNFLKALIENAPAEAVGFRIWETESNAVSLSHENNWAAHQRQYSTVVRILPQRAIYNAIYNVYAKKILIEQISQQPAWHHNLHFWYDKCFYNIQEYHQLIKHDIATNVYPNVVNFDQLLDVHYVQQVLQQYFDLDMDHNRQQIVENYRQAQLPVQLLDDSEQSMEKICQDITDQQFAEDPWFWAYCVYKYEHNNRLKEQQRLWSVNDITEPATRRDLASLSSCYRNQ